eukprot:GHVU01200731.1.p1 GENE.GHVU01200731.1~~GHVU01200731.1.p1  ORF type:complete len:264 (+),score=9.34 GHVU01200731.1:37-792(+)
MRVPQVPFFRLPRWEAVISQLRSRRCFAAASSSGAADGNRTNDQSLEGRYASALFRVAKGKGTVDKVFEDMETLRNAIEESRDFRLFIETPGVPSKNKIEVMAQFGSKCAFDQSTQNLLSVLIENRRFSHLKKVVDTYEDMYRAYKGEVKCSVTSAKVTRLFFILVHELSDMSASAPSGTHRSTNVFRGIGFEISPALRLQALDVLLYFPTNSRWPSCKVGITEPGFYYCFAAGEVAESVDGAASLSDWLH